MTWLDTRTQRISPVRETELDLDVAQLAAAAELTEQHDRGIRDRRRCRRPRAATDDLAVRDAERAQYVSLTSTTFPSVSRLSDLATGLARNIFDSRSSPLRATAKLRSAATRARLIPSIVTLAITPTVSRAAIRSRSRASIGPTCPSGAHRSADTTIAIAVVTSAGSRPPMYAAAMIDGTYRMITTPLSSWNSCTAVVSSTAAIPTLRPRITRGAAMAGGSAGTAPREVVGLTSR